jgi:hypothetical protein
MCKAEYSTASNTDVKYEWSYTTTPSRTFITYTGTTIPLLNVGAQQLKRMLFTVKVPAYNTGVGHIIMTEDFQCFLQYLYLNAVSAP